MTLQTDPQFIQLDCRGLFTMPNSLSQVPHGSLLQAENVVVSYNGLLSVRRGIKQYGTSLATLTGISTTEIFQEFFYKGSKLVWYGDATVPRFNPAKAYFAYDSDNLGTWVQTTHPFPPPAYALTDTYRSAQSNDNIYFTSTSGILKTDDPAHALYSAGGLPGLDGVATLVNSAGFLDSDTAVAYRMVWQYTDANHNAIVGTPSTRLVVENTYGIVTDTTSGATFAIVTIPSGSEFTVSTTTGLTPGDTITQGAATTTISTVGLAFTITSVPNSTTLDVSSAAGLSVDDTIVQGANTTVIQGISGTTLTVSSTAGFIASTAYDTSVLQITVGSTAGFIAGQSSNVQLVYTIPHGTTTAYQWQIYRTIMSASATTDPGDNEQLVATGNPSPTDITNGYFTYVDALPQDQLGANLYTNATEEGISQANNIPPLANDMCFFFGYMIYGAATTQQLFLLSLLSAEPPNGIQIGDTFTVANGGSSFTLTGAASENISLGEFKVYTGGDPGSDILQTKESIIRVLNRQSQTLVYAYDASDTSTAGALPGDFYLQEQNIGGGTFYVFSSRTTAWSPTLSPELSFSITAVVDATHLTVSSTTGITAGDTIAQNPYSTTVTTVVDSTHLIVASTTGFATGTAYDVSTGSSSLPGGGLGGGYCSKFQEPEAVPVANTINAGNPNFEWLRCLPLRNSIIVLKADGLFQLTGTTYPFTVTTLDTGTILTAPESCAVMNNQVFAYTNQGVVAIAETGPGIISRPIENTLQQISSYLYPNFPEVTFGTAYETDRKYLLSTISSSDGFEQATIQYVYDTITEAWTAYVYPVPVWDIQESPDDHRLYVDSATSAYPYVFQEKKSFTNIDYADIEIPVTITGSSGTTVDLASTTNVTVGWSLVQLVPESIATPSQILNLSVITAILNSTQITVADVINWDLTGGSFTAVEQPIPVSVRYCPIIGVSAAPNTSGNPGIIKNFKEIQFMFQDVAFTSVNVTFSSDFISNSTPISLVPIPAGQQWGQFKWGQVPWSGIDQLAVSSVRTYIPLYARRAHWLNLGLQLSQAMVGFTYGGCVLTYTDVTTRSK
jgi:hypothetical protein